MSNYTVPAEVSANPSLVEFPTDPDGMYSKFQKEGLLAVQRVYSEDQFNRLMCVMGIIAKHAKAHWDRTRVEREALYGPAKVAEKAPADPAGKAPDAAPAAPQAEQAG